MNIKMYLKNISFIIIYHNVKFTIFEDKTFLNIFYDVDGSTAREKFMVELTTRNIRKL